MDFIIIGLSFMLCMTIILLIYVLFNFKYLCNELRDICAEPSGYFKYGQMIFLGFTTFSFLILMFYNIFNEKIVSSLDIFLNITVGFLGTILGMFYGSKGIKYASESRKETLLKKAKEVLLNSSKRIENKIKKD